MKYLIHIVGALLFFVGCHKKAKQTTKKVDATYVQQIPDSLRTPQQKELVRKILQLSLTHIKVVNNHMVFDMSKEDFRKTGIPLKYYDLFKQNIKENNIFIKENNIKNVDKMLESYRKNIRKHLK